MPIERPDWNYDNNGREVVPADEPQRPVGYDGPTRLEETDAFADMQRKAKGEVAKRDDGTADRATSENTVTDGGGFVPDVDPSVLADWQGGGDAAFEHRLGLAQSFARSIADEAGGDGVMASFDGLPTAIQSAVYSEISLSGGGSHGLPPRMS